MLEFVGYLLLATVVLYLSVFWHELGHFVLARRSGFVVTSFGQGLARPFFVRNWGDTRVYLCLRQCFQGLTFVYYPELYPASRQMVGMLAGGLLFNAIATAAAILLHLLFPALDPLWVIVAIFNGLFVLTSAVPFQFKLADAAFANDGALILRSLLGREVFTSGPGILQSIKVLTPLWDSVGDTQARCVYRMAAALLWHELGDADEARRLYSEAMALPAPERDRSFRRAYGPLVSGIISSEAGAPEAAEAAFDEAQQEYQASGVSTGLLLTEWARAEMRVRYGQSAAEARRILDTLKADPFFATRPERRFALFVSCLLADITLGDLTAAEDGVGRYAADRRRFPSLVRDLQVYRAMGGLYGKAGNARRAQEYYGRAMEAAKKLYAAFADPADRGRFVRTQEALLAEARAVLEAQGRHDEAATLAESFFAGMEETARRDTEAEVARERSWRRAGAWLTLADFVLAFGGVYVSVTFLSRGTPAFALLFFAACTIIFGLCSALLLLLAPRGRRVGGWSVYLASFPWFLTLVFLLAPTSP